MPCNRRAFLFRLSPGIQHTKLPFADQANYLSDCQVTVSAKHRQVLR